MPAFYRRPGPGQDRVSVARGEEWVRFVPRTVIEVPERKRRGLDEAKREGPAARAATAPSDEDRRAVHREEAARDRALVERVRGGDTRAFDELYRLYHTRAYHLAFRVTKNPESALDVVQEAFIKVFKNLEGFEGTSSFYTWLYRIVMNLAIDRVRAEARGQRLVEFDEKAHKDDPAEARQGPGESPLRRVLRSELTDRIREVLDELPEYHREAIVLREIDGLSYDEIAEAMNCPKGTVMSRLFHARHKMQERLAPYLTGQLEIDD